jgi:uncharacterized protein (DUF433 family)
VSAPASRTRRFPGIGFRGDDADRRPWVIGTALDVWQVVEASAAFDSIETMARDTDLEERQIRLALAYREHYPDEIDAAIDENNRDADELRRLYPFLQIAEVE